MQWALVLPRVVNCRWLYKLMAIHHPGPRALEGQHKSFLSFGKEPPVRLQCQPPNS